MTEATFRGQISDLQALRRFLFAGHATLTLVSGRTGERFTYKVQAPKDAKPGDRVVHFVKVLTGSDNTADYQFLGTIFEERAYSHGRKSRLSNTAPSAVAFSWFMDQVFVMRPDLLSKVQVFHEGACGRCGRALTVPESVATGFGPECSDKLGLERVAVVTRTVAPTPALDAAKAAGWAPGTGLPADPEGPSLGVAPVVRQPLVVRRKSVTLGKAAAKALEAIRQENAAWLNELALSDEDYAILAAEREAEARGFRSDPDFQEVK